MSAPHHCLPGALSTLLAGQPLSEGKIRFAWRAAVGQALDRATTIALSGTTLEVTPADADWARELRRLKPLILSRLVHVLGSGVVERIEVRGPANGGPARR
jgi:hypothetical protein